MMENCCQCLSSETLYRCQDCEGGELICRTCIVDYHCANPLHRIQVCSCLYASLLQLINYSRNGRVLSSNQQRLRNWGYESNQVTNSENVVMYHKLHGITTLLFLILRAFMKYDWTFVIVKVHKIILFNFFDSDGFQPVSKVPRLQ